MELKIGQVVIFGLYKKIGKGPDLRGDAHVTCPNCGASTMMQISLWKKVSKNDRAYLSGVIRKFENQFSNDLKEKEAADKRNSERPVEDQAKDLPF